VFVEMNQNQ